MDLPVWSLAVKRLERTFRRWRLIFSRWIYEGTGPRYALVCFATHVEAKSAPCNTVLEFPFRDKFILWLRLRAEVEIVKQFQWLADETVSAPDRRLVGLGQVAVERDNGRHMNRTSGLDIAFRIANV